MIFSMIGLLLALAEDPSLTAAALRGKQIYLTGLPVSGRPLMVRFGPEQIEISAAIMPCVNCHGHDGRGRAEAGIVPSNITWNQLTKPYGVEHQGGRKTPPYGTRDLVRAIAMGIDSGGTDLSTTMPRFLLEREEMADLVAYLQRLGSEPEPGLSDDRLVLGVLLPPPNLSAYADVLRPLLETYAADLNRQGGFFRRKLTMVYCPLPSDEADTSQVLETFLDEEQPFALVAGYIAGRETEITDLLEQRRVPMVGAMTLYPRIGFPLNRHVFYLEPGVVGQMKALARYAHVTADKERGGAVLVGAPRDEPVAEALSVLWQRLGRGPLAILNLPDDPALYGKLVADLAGEDRQVLFLPGGGATALAGALQDPTYQPLILMPAALLADAWRQPPAHLEKRVFLAMDRVPGDYRRIDLWQRLAEAGDLKQTLMLPQFSALAAAEVLAVGLRRGGREITREILVEKLESLQMVPTGFSPPVSFGVNNRVGTDGAYVVTYDYRADQFVSVSRWIDAD